MLAASYGVRPKTIVDLRSLQDEESFAKSIAMERKRAERANRLLLLMLLEIRDPGPGLPRLSSEVLMASFAMFIRESDIMGWYQDGRTVGIIFTEITSDHRDSIKATMLQRISGVLYRNLTFQQFNQVAISCYSFPEEWNYDVPLRPSSPLLYPEVESRDSEAKTFRIAKRIIDVVGSTIALILLSWLFVLIAILVRCSSPGPVFYRQARVGRYGVPFVFIKFRSMYADNDAAIHENYMHEIIKGRAAKHSTKGNREGVYKLARDPRVTPIGVFLRKTSLDELPQLYNVLKGEMSLVGPRPAIPYEVQAYQSWHRRRILEAKPGMTGLWQVSGRSRLSFDEMVRLDVQYATSRSLWLDFRILIKTPRTVILGDGAC